MRLSKLTRGWLLLMAVFLLTAATMETVWAAADKYRLVWNHDPATTMTIGWCQDSSNTHYLVYGTNPDPATWTRADVEDTTTFIHPDDGNSSSLVSYFVNLENLSPDTAYYFQVCEEGGSCGDTIWFRTAPATPKPFTFIAGGDSRTIQQARQNGNILVSKLRPLFIVYGGDYQSNGTVAEWQEWLDDWQLIRSSDGRMYPIIPTHGNHENDVRDMVQKIFDTPNPDAYSALSVGGNLLRIYTLNTELEPGVGYGAFSGQDDSAWNAQTSWLRNDLYANAGSYRWIAASYHRPLRPHRASKAEGIGRYNDWAPLFKQYGVDLAIECDSHLAKFTYPVSPDNALGSYEGFIRDDINGTTYIGEGSWGAPTRENDDDKPWTLASDSFWQFNLIQLDSSNITIRKVWFGSEDISYDPLGVAELTQAEQDADPFAVPAGVQFWHPLSGPVLTIPFQQTDVDNIRYITTNATWRFNDSGNYPGDGWKDPSFDDTLWSRGNGQLGYGDGDEQTVVSYGGDAENKHITTWFRSIFNVNDPSKVIRLVLRILRDDGAVIYINGTEAARTNMPEGEISPDIPALSAVGGTDEDRYYEISIDPDLLQAGANTIAVEVHQASPTSSDLSFDLDLTAIESRNSTITVPEAPTDLTAAEVGQDFITLSWNDNSDNEVKFELQRRIGDGPWQIIEPQVDADTTEYSDNMLMEGQEYSYRIRSYNAGGRSSYSNELTVETLSSPVPVIPGYVWDFEDGTLGTLTAISKSSNHDWEVYEYHGQHFARMNGYGADEPSDDWLITPALPLSYFQDLSLSFDSAYNYGGPELEVYVSTDYDPETGNGTWTQLQSGVDFQLPDTGHYTFVNSGPIDLTPYISEHTYIAFRYLSTGTGGGDGRIWEIDNITLRGNPVYRLEKETFSEPVIPAGWTAYSRSSNADWHIETRADQQGAFCNGYGADAPSDDWLISPAFTVNPSDSAMLQFDYYAKYGGPMIEVYISTNYPGHGDPMDEAVTWHRLQVPMDSSIYDEWKSVEPYDISSFTGENVRVAFRYVSTGTGPGDGRRWGVDNVGVSLMPPQPLTVNLNISPAQELYTTADPITFIPAVTGGKKPYSYNWDFGNGDSSNEESPVYTFPEPGSHTVTLTVTDGDGISKSSTVTLDLVEAVDEPVPDKIGNLRVATFNVAMAWKQGGEERLLEYLSEPGWDQASKVAEIIQRVNPDVVLLNEFDYYSSGEAVALFKENYLERSQNGASPVDYPYTFIAPVNTGVPSGVDLNNDGDTDDPEDCFGYGWYPGAYGMVILSKYPIDTESVRTFQHFLWKDMPGNMMPTDYYSPEAQNIFRLSSKSHWDVPVIVNGKRIHILASHPTPPVFDGPEDRNGRRNHDEIRFWADYVTPDQANYIYDDNGNYGGIEPGASFIILGDQNADPDEGDSTDNAIMQLLGNSNIDPSVVPESNGAEEATGDRDDTASWGLRADYVLPSVAGVDPLQAGVFWPVSRDVKYRLVKDNASSDHRMTWIDLEFQQLTGDLDGDNDIDRNDIRMLRSYLRQDASVCPECDMDGDGIITIMDARKLVTMCSRPRCAIR